MRAEVVEELEGFIARGDLWRPDKLDAMVEHLEVEDDPVARQLGANLDKVLRRSRRQALPLRLAADIEGVVYPRLWKLMEAVWDGLPECELQIRVEALVHRLAPLLTEPA
ncbi:MAG: hypothetical protein ACR2G7_08745 [Acidimicrobiales bacterium]